MLLDIIMPKLDGLSVMDKVHNDSELTKRPAFIVVTAIGQEKVTENAFAMGADYYIMKPFDGEMIRRRIKQMRPGMTAAARRSSGAFAVERGKRGLHKPQSGDRCYQYDP